MSQGKAQLVERLALTGWRNLAPLELTPGPRFNVVHGENGAGKSNLLEAVHYLAALRSFRGAKTDDAIMLGGERARLEARVAGGVVPSTYRVELRRGVARSVAIDGKRPRSSASWKTSIQTVVFHPGDVELAGGAPEARRALLDRVLEQLDCVYGSALQSYTKALKSRNRLLRIEGTDRKAITAYDEILASAGSVLWRARANLVSDLSPLAQQAFTDVSGEGVKLGVTYRPRVAPESTVDAIREALAQSLMKDLARGFTAEGPHGDDLELNVEGTRARHHASQGQQRAIVLALKIAEVDVLARRAGRVPILLLDDVSSELDRRRNQQLFERIARMGGQVFLTTTHPEFIRLSHDRVDFQVEAGRVLSQG